MLFKKFNFHITNTYLVIFLLFIVNFFLIVLWLSNKKIMPQKLQDFKKDFHELEELKGKDLSFKELSDYFKKLSQVKTARYAFEVLKRAPIPPNIDLHLLGHIVGDELYKQEGFEGIKACTDDLRNACSHSIVVGLFTDKGEGALTDISTACRNAPGGKGAYTMCFHGLGHGILAYYGYNMEKTVETCKKTAIYENNYRESIECIGGSVMEIIGGGFHDRELWEKQRVKYLSKKDPLMPCTSGFMPIEAQGQCYVYLTPHLFEAAGANLGNPMPKDYKKAFTFCDKIPAKDVINRETCFGGFGKEFVVLARVRDIRKESIENMTKEELKKIYDWCLLANDNDGTKNCLDSALNSLYWGGENKIDLAIRFCQTIPDSTYQTGCFKNLIGNVAVYKDDPDYQRDFCQKMPENFRDDCNKTFRLN